MKLYFMLAYRRGSAPNPVLAEVFDLLKQGGHEVEIGIAEDLVLQPERLSAEHDLYILKSHSDLWLSVAGVLHAQGARLLNPYPACTMARDKIIASRLLSSARIPIPQSWVTGNLTLLQAIVAMRPLIIKPHVGTRGNGIRSVRDLLELALVPPLREMSLIQELVPSNGRELKVYVVGDHVFAVQKPFPAPATACRSPCELSCEVRDIALRCGQVFGLSLYGLDILEGPNGPVVIDVNYFPSYRDIVGVAPLIAAHIIQHGHEVKR
jgi:ribosomal protein S6--L-glutamate ligase